MVRPLKEPELRMEATLIVKMTADLKGLIKRAADSAKIEMSAWIRPILEDAAKRQLKRR